MAAEKSRNEADDFTTDEDSDDGKFDWDPGAKARAAQEDPGGSGKAGGAKGMMYSVMYSGVASGVYDLWDAARDGHNDLIMDSLNSGIDVNDTTTLGDWTALQFAARGGKLSSVQLLLDHGANVNQQNSAGGNTALHVCDGLDVAKLLVASGADINLTNSAGSTALHRVAVSGHVDVAEYLISLGMDVSWPNLNGNTPLHLATTVEVAELLLRAGAGCNCKNKDGELPHEHHSKEKRHSIANAIDDFRTFGVEVMGAKLAVRKECDSIVAAARAGKIEAEDLMRGAQAQLEEERAARRALESDLSQLQKEHGVVLEALAAAKEGAGNAGQPATGVSGDLAAKLQALEAENQSLKVQLFEAGATSSRGIGLSSPGLALALGGGLLLSLALRG